MDDRNVPHVTDVLERSVVHLSCGGVTRASKGFVCVKCGREICPNCGSTTGERQGFCTSNKTPRCNGQVVYPHEVWVAKQRHYLTARRLARQYSDFLLAVYRAVGLRCTRKIRMSAKRAIHVYSTHLWHLLHMNRNRFYFLDREYGCGKDSWGDTRLLRLSVRFEMLEEKRAILVQLGGQM